MKESSGLGFRRALAAARAALDGAGTTAEERAIALTLLEMIDRAADVASDERSATDVDDASSPHELEQRLSEARHEVERRDDFIAVVSHELRNPLTPVRMLVTLLEAETRDPTLVDPALVARRVEKIARMLDRFHDVLTRLVDFTRIRSGRLDLVLERLDLREVVRSVVERHAAEAAAARCRVDLDDGPPIVGAWDRMRVEQVATNLLTNALKFGAGAPVGISLDDLGDRAQLVVRDHGPGIAPDERDALFNKFERGGRYGGGFGVGLWVVRRIVDAFGGAITVESSPGDGAAFRVELPKRGPHGEHAED